MIDQVLRQEILEILSGADDLTIATVREDGYPQATTVSYASDDLDIYFGTAAGSQKTKNIAFNNKVSLTVNLPYNNWGEIRGLSIGGRAKRLTEPSEIARADQLLFRKFRRRIAEYASGGRADIAFFRVRPEVVSLLDYRKGFSHSELVEFMRP